MDSWFVIWQWFFQGSNVIASVGGEIGETSATAMAERVLWHQSFLTRESHAGRFHLAVLCGWGQYHHDQLRTLLLAMLCMRQSVIQL
jgi:hypothetical protein